MKYVIEHVREGIDRDEKGKEYEVVKVRFRIGEDFVGRLSIPKEKATEDEVARQVKEYAERIAKVIVMKGETE